jgi:hypothetical protein
MSTHSNISIKTDKGYETIYCHFDGYPSYMYPMLRDWYGTEERAKALVALGDASSINRRLTPSQGSAHCFDKPEEDVCVFYNRDRGESWEDNAPVVQPSKQEAVRCYYSYVFEDGAWHVYIGGKEVEDYSKLED